MYPLTRGVTVTSLIAAVLPVNSFQFTTSFCSGLLTVTSAGGGPFAPGCWLLQPASQRVNATKINRLPQRCSRLADVMCCSVAEEDRRSNCRVMSSLDSIYGYFTGGFWFTSQCSLFTTSLFSTASVFG